MTAQPNPSTALVTGANSGVGIELTRRLLGAGWQVVALIRSEFPAGDPLIAQARADGRLRVYRADLSDYAQLKPALRTINERETRIDVLFNNAAAAVGGLEYSPQGRELHFEVNTVVPYIIAMELKPLLAQGEHKTIVNVSSNALLTVKAFDLELLERPTAYKPISGPYGASKLGLSLWTQALAAELRAEGIEIRSVNPGGNKTKMTSSPHFPLWLRPIRALFFSHPSRGAELIDAVARGPWRGTSGVFVNRGKATPFKFAQHAPGVLARVRAIHQGEFLSQPGA